MRTVSVSFGSRDWKGIFGVPGKFEIMQEVRKGLDGLKVDRTAGRTEWTSAIKTELCRIGRCKFGCKPDNNLWLGSTRSAERFANAIGEFNGSRTEDPWLPAAWEKKLEWNEGEYERAWRFSYFTIETNTAIVHPLSRE